MQHIRKVNGKVIVSPEYRAWRNMKYRCLNPNSPQYADYGGRGITIAPKWIRSFQTFIDDIGLRPPGRSLERHNNNKPYRNGNVYWATPKEQAANRRKSKPGRNPRPERKMTNVNLGQPVKNKHKVPKKMWNKWSNFARRVFNDMMYSMRPNMQFAFLHPSATPQQKEHWQTTRYNAAWSAAEAVRGFKFASATKTTARWAKREKKRVKAKA